ncbi:MAG: hypothetical protein Kow0059_15730 [Candidatus Sumerlaeia bacterium]
MRFRRSQAFILKTFPYSDSSLVVHALTSGEGRVHLLARGARRRSNRLLQGLEPFCRAELTWIEKPGRELQTLREAALVRGNEAFRAHLGVWAMGCVFFELVDRAAVSGERQGALFHLAASFGDTADKLIQSGEFHRLVRRIEQGGESRQICGNSGLSAGRPEGAAEDRSGRALAPPPSGVRRAPAEGFALILPALLPLCFDVLRVQGVAPLVGRCVRCGTGRGPFPVLDLHQGGVVCSRCLGAAGRPAGATGAESRAAQPAESVGTSGFSCPPPGSRVMDAGLVALDESVRRILFSWLVRRRPFDVPAPPDTHRSGRKTAAEADLPSLRLSAQQERALLGVLDRLAAEHFDRPLKSLPLLERLLEQNRKGRG